MKCLIFIHNFQTDTKMLKVKEMAICSPNFTQVGKGRDRNTDFCRVRQENVKPKERLFFMSNPVKTVF